METTEYLIELLEKEVELKRAYAMIEKQKKFIDSRLKIINANKDKLIIENYGLKRELESTIQSRNYWEEKGKKVKMIERLMRKIEGFEKSQTRIIDELRKISVQF